MDVEVVPEAAEQPGSQQRNWPRIIVAVAIVWVISAVSYLPHLTIIPAILFLIATLIWVPNGCRYSDRLIVATLAATTYVVLVAWISPFLPFLVHPITLVGLLGTPLAVVVAMGRQKRVGWHVGDVVSLGALVVGAVLWYLPFRGRNLGQTIGQLLFGADNAPHMGMMRGVWVHHGYEIVNTGTAPINGYAYQSYPEAVHAVLAAVGSVVLGVDEPPSVADSIFLYAVLLCLEAGMLAFIMAWAVERFCRYSVSSGVAVYAAQIVCVVLLILGPIAWVLFSSASYILGLFMMIVAAVLAACAARRPLRYGVLTALAIIVCCITYPLLCIVIPLVWLLYVWRTKTYWRAHVPRLLGATAVTALLSSPMLIMLLVREIDHGFDSGGVFDPIPIAFFVGTACGVAGVVALGRRAVPRPILGLAWVAGIFTAIVSILAIVQFFRTGAEQYYAIKTMYASLILCVLVLAAAAAVLLSGWQGKPFRPGRTKLVSIISGLVVAVLAGAAGLFSVNTAESPLDAAFRFAPGYMWVSGAAKNNDGPALLQFSEVSEGRIPLYLPCESTTNRWLGFLGGGMPDLKFSIYTDACTLEGLTEIAKRDPNLLIDVFVLEPKLLDELKRLKTDEGLTNVRVISINEEQVRKQQAQQGTGGPQTFPTASPSS